MLSKKHRATAIQPSSPELLIFVQLICGVLLGLIVEANCNRINIIHIPIAYCITLGIWESIQLLKTKAPKSYKPAAAIFAIVYLACGVSYTASYFTTYDKTMYSVFQGGLKEALEDGVSDGTTHITGANFPQVLFYSAYPAPRFAETVEWVDPGSAYLKPTKFDNFDFRSFTDGTPVPGDKYLCRTNDKTASDWFKHNNMHVEQFGTFLVGSIDDQGTRQ